MFNQLFLTIMRKYLFLGLTLISLLGLFVSCGEDSQPPSISLLTGSGYYVPSTPVTPGEPITFGVTAIANADSKENITNITVTGTINGTPTELANITYNDATVTVEWDMDAPPTAGTATITIVATDAAGETAEVSFDIVTQGTAKTLVTHAITLGAQDHATGSFCASFEGTVWTVGELKTGNHYAEVDIVYYYGATNKWALFSPKAIVDADISWGGLVPVANWTTKNATKFRKAAATDYDNATYYTVETLGALAELDIANGGDNPIEGLAVGDAYAFKTADGKYGIFKVTAITLTNDGTISFTIKIQE